MQSTRTKLTRRSFLGASALVVSFSLLPRQVRAQDKPAAGGLPFGDMKAGAFLDSWIGIDEKGAVTVFTGKAELGQGITTALMQCAAEQLAISPNAITMVTARPTSALSAVFPVRSTGSSNTRAALRSRARLRLLMRRTRLERQRPISSFKATMTATAEPMWPCGVRVQRAARQRSGPLVRLLRI